MKRLLRKILKVRKKMTPHKVQVHFEGHSVIETYSGQTILRKEKKNDIDISHYCGGTCSCSTCMVHVLSGQNNLSKIQPREKLVLGVDKSEKNHRLACQAKVIGNVHLSIPMYF